MRVTPGLSIVRWRKSSFSGNQAGDECVEVSDDVPGSVPVRDSKHTTGPVLVLDEKAWQLFINGLKEGSL